MGCFLGRSVKKLTCLWVLGGVLAGMSVVIAAESEIAGGRCVKDGVRGFLEGRTPDWDKDAKELRKIFNESLLQRFFDRGTTKEQKRIINSALTLRDSEGWLSQAAMERQDRLLKEAGFRADEIGRMRKTGLLGKLRPVEEGMAESLSKSASGVPEFLKIEPVRLRPVTRDDLWAMQGKGKDPKKFQYVVDFENNVHLVAEGELKSPDASFWVMNSMDADGNGSYVLVRESGELEFDKELKRARFTPKYSLSQTDQELAEMTEKLKAMDPKIEISKVPHPAQQELRVVDCLEYMAGRQRGSGYIRENMISTNVNYFEGLVLVNALTAAGEKKQVDESKKDSNTLMESLSSPKNRARASDLLSTNVNSFVASYINGRVLAQNYAEKFGKWRAAGINLGTRAGIMGTSVAVQYGGYSVALKGEGKDEKARTATLYNLSHGAVKLPINFFMDEAIIKDLPVRLFDNCLKGGKSWLFINPASIRFLYGQASTLGYWGGRYVFVERKFDEQDEKIKVMKERKAKEIHKEKAQ